MLLPTTSAKTMPNLEAHRAGLRSSPAFLVVGFPRSGFSLLQQILEAHPLIAVAPDVYWIIEYFETHNGLNLDGRMASQLINKWIAHDRFASFQLDPKQIIDLVPAGESIPVGIFLSRLLDRYAKARGKAVAGSESPEFVRHLPAVHQLWPDAKVIHLIRDGRDICLSLLDEDGAALGPAKQFATWTTDKHTTLALWWRRKVRLGRKAGQSAGPARYLEIRYESLLAQSAEECSKLCAFLALPYDKAMLRSGLEYTAEHPECCSQMPDSDLERWEAAAGDLLDEMGYQRSVSRLRPDVRQRAAQLKEIFTSSKRDARFSPATLEKIRRGHNWTNPFVFIVGCPRSGTTLLQRLLNAHPDIVVPPETFWIPYFFQKRIGVSKDGLVTADLVRQLFSYYKFYRMKLDRHDLEKLIESEQPLPYARFVTRLFDLHAAGEGKSLAGDKTPDYVRSIRVLHTLWPKAKFVHLIRDGRDVCLSAIAWKRKVDKLVSMFTTWMTEPVTTASLWWEWHVRQGREQGSILGPDLYYEMRYESLISDPSRECERLCMFLGLSHDDAMLRFYEGRTRTEPGLDAKSAWLPITAGLRDWRTEISSEDVERVEAAVGSLLGELGYPRSFSQPRAEAMQKVNWIRELFVENTRAVGDSLP